MNVYKFGLLQANSLKIAIFHTSYFCDNYTHISVYGKNRTKYVKRCEWASCENASFYTWKLQMLVAKKTELTKKWPKIKKSITQEKYSIRLSQPHTKTGAMHIQ